MSNVLKIGKIVKTHGLKGMLKIYPYTNDLADFNNFKTVYTDRALKHALNIKSVTYQKGMVLLAFDGYNHINDVTNLLNSLLYIDKLVIQQALNENEYFIEDLMGLSVYSIEGKLLGDIADFRETSSQTTLEIKHCDKRWFLPFVNAFIKDVDLVNKRLIVKLIKGLYDEN